MKYRQAEQVTDELGLTKTIFIDGGSARISVTMPYVMDFDEMTATLGAILNGLNNASPVALGSIRSERKAAASRENGKLGGRPKQSMFPKDAAIRYATPEETLEMDAEIMAQRHLDDESQATQE